MTSNATRPKTILLVDDEADIREVLDITLADWGYHILAAENAQDGLALYDRHRPPVVLTDIKMPGMDGIELLQRIKQLDPDAEVIMITGHGDMDLAIRSLKNEATDFITKPVNVEALDVALKRAEDRILMRRQLKEYTESLERLIVEKTQLQDHLSSLGLMIGSISHGLKGLLTGLDGGGYILESGLRKSQMDQVHEGWGIIRQMADRIRKLVQDILYYAKERELNWEAVDVHRFVEEVALVVGPKFQREGIELVMDIDPGVGSCRIDPGAVHSALVNILENALDACCRDLAKPHTVVFGVKRQHDKILFSVTDDGIGMDADTKAKLFDLFYSTKGQKGTGFGLFIAQKIVSQHGGDILVSSSPGKGAVFTVRIPVAEARMER